MREYAQKQSQPQKSESSGVGRSGIAKPGPDNDAHPVADAGRTIDDELAPPTLETRTEEPKDPSPAVDSSRLGHDFKRIPIFPVPHGAIQKKLEINEPGDESEREADRAAEQVARSMEPGAGARPRCACGAIAGPDGECASCRAKRLGLQKKSPGQMGPTVAPPSVHRVLHSPGQLLDSTTRARMQPHFGVDLGRVRLHTDAQASDSAREVHALAYTVGRDIVFRASHYAPETVQGSRLLAHELAHVEQQNGTASALPHGEANKTQVQRQVAPEYVINEAFQGRTQPGAPERIFFPRNSAVIPASENAKIDTFKSGPDRTVNLTLLGLATEEEIAATPTLPMARANAVATALATPRAAPPPMDTAHSGTRTPTAGTLANTQGRSNLSFNRAVELLRPGQVSLSPGTAIAPATTCNAALETAFQAAKTMAFNWIDTTRPEVQARPLTGPITADLDRFFGNHDPATARRVDHNLGLIRDEVASIAQAAHHDCADPNLPSCVSAIAFNSGGNMTICSGYASHTPEDRARNLVHEAGHSTAGLRITGSRNAPRTSDFAYRYERLVHLLGAVNPDRALSNSDSYSMFLMTRRASGAITPDLLPTTDPAPTGFASPAQADRAKRAVALAEVWLRVARQGLQDLHGGLRGIGTGRPVPPDLGDPARLDRILTQTKLSFPPILSTPTIRSDDLLMIAGVLDRYAQLLSFADDPMSISPGATTTLTRVAPVPPARNGTITLTVDPAFLAANDRVHARTVVDKLVELAPTARITVAMRPNYAAFAEFARDMFQ